MSFNNRKHSTGYAFKPFLCEEVVPDRQLKGSRVPLPRSGHRVVADSCNLYSFGGYNPLVAADDNGNTDAYPLFQELWKFNFASRRWTKFCRQESLPQELASNAAVRNGNLLMVYACVKTGDVSFCIAKFVQFDVHCRR